MRDPEEKDKHTQPATDNTAGQQSKDIQDTNWDKHQQVDEEGNQVKPEDIK